MVYKTHHSSLITHHYLYGLLLLAPLCLGAQDAPASLERRTITEQQWQKAAGDMDYSKDVPRPEKPKPDPPTSTEGWNPWNWGFNSPFLGTFLQVLAILAAVAAIGFGIYRMMREPRNRRIARDGVEITVDNLEAYLPETDLDRFLRDALAQQNFPLAIRLYFLQLIKDLSQAGAIHWSKEKTNRDYLREMRNHRLAQPFGQATRNFERIWYGNAPLSAADFARLEPEFKGLLAQVM